MSTTAVSPAREVLNSWKEIARYLDRGVRTVQRWEVESGLPVRRPRSNRAGRSAVFAFRSELDAWLRSCHMEKPKPAVSREPVTPNGHKRLYLQRRQLSSITRKLILDSQRLQRAALDSQAQLNHAVLRLRDTVIRLVAGSATDGSASPLSRRDSLFLTQPALTTLDVAE